MKVREIMMKEVKSISKDISAKEALGILSENEISGLPVIDENGRLLGMFTEKEVLSHILPSYLEKVGRFIYEDDPKATRKKAAELDSIKVEALMRRRVVTTTEDTTLCEAARLMLTEKARRLPVVDNSGKVVGMVARCDIVKALASPS
jgi:CBS domain-containing protein